MRVLHVGFGFRPWRSGGLIEYAEDLMDFQVSRDWQVGYFFAGRQYPVFRQPHLHRWRRRRVEMFEVWNSPVVHGADRGSIMPALELDEPHTEALFRRVLRDFQPEVVHFQELAGLPSSLIEVAGREGTPSVMTLQDYYLLCPTLKLFTPEGENCAGMQGGAGCARCCRGSGGNLDVLMGMTRRYETERLKDSIPAGIKAILKRGVPRTVNGTASPIPVLPVADAPPGDYMRRRERNVARLKLVNLLVAQSHRVEQIYRQAVGDARMTTVQLTLSHLAQLPYRRFGHVAAPVTFATLNGCYNRQKGAWLLLDAMERLHAAGLAERFRLEAWGGLSGELRERFLRFANFSHHGWYKVHQLDEMLAGVHVGVIPSVWEEAFGFVGLEYLAKGIPVIGNARGGIVDYTVTDRTGWVNRSCTGEELAGIMADLIRRPEAIAALNERIGKERDRILKPVSRHFEEMEGLYRQVCGS